MHPRFNKLRTPNVWISKVTFPQQIQMKVIIIYALSMWAACCFSTNAQVVPFQEAKARADNGDAFAQAVVAMHYQLGWDTEKDVKQAARYAHASAKANHALGLFRVGTMMRNGEGFAKDEKKGLELQGVAYKALKDAKDPYSITATAIMIFQGKVVGQNIDENERRRIAAGLYKQAADMGYAPAQFNYAMALNDGHGTIQDSQARDVYLQNSDRQNYPLAVRWLAKNTPPLISDRITEANKRVSPPSIVGSSNGKKVLIDSVKKMVKKPTLESVRPVVHQAPENVFCVDVSTDQKQIVVLTGTKLSTYEGGSGRLINTFDATNNPSEVYFREGKSSSVLLVSSSRKEISILNTYDGRLKTLASQTKGIPVGYDPVTDSMILFISFLEAGRGHLGGEIVSLDLKTGDMNSKGDINTGLQGHVRAFVRDDGELGVVGFFNDAMEGIQPIDCFATMKNGQWVVMSEESAVLGVKKFLRLPQSAKQLSRNFYGLTEFEFSGKRFLLDQMLAKSARAAVLPLDNTPLQTIYAVGSNGPSFKSIPPGTIRRIDGLSSSDDGSKLSLWNLNEKWIKDKFAPDHDNFYSRTQRAAMDLPPVIIDTKNFDFASLPTADRFVWSTSMSPDGKSVVLMITDKKAVPVGLPGTSPAWGGEQSLSVNAQRMTVFYPSLQTETHNVSTSVTDPFEGNVEQLSVWLNGQTDIAVDNAFFSTEPRKSVPYSESFTTKARAGKSVFVENSIERKASGEYKFSAVVKLLDESDTVIDSFQIDENVEYAFPIEAAKVLVVSGGTLFVFDFDTSEVVSALISGVVVQGEKILSVCPTSRLLWYREPSGKSLRLVSWDTNGALSETISLYPQLYGAPVYLTTDGFYASVNRARFGLHFSDNSRTYPLEQFDLRLNRPDIVLERLGAPAEAIAIAKQLREKRLRRMSVTEEKLQPDFHVPEIEIVSQIPATFESDYVNVSIKASDSKYPLDRLRVYVNNVPINGKEGELLRDAKLQTLERTIQIKLAVGRNKIQVSVLNSAGAESLYANAEINCTASRHKPTLYAVALGVSEYSNPDWNLKYAAKDARDILDRIRSKSGSSYGEVKELLLTDREVTKETLTKFREFLSQATIDDTVLIFVAGHGLLDSKYDYYFGTSDIDFDNPSEKGIAFEEFDDLLAEMPCLRKSLLIDTCHAGELDEDEKKALATSQTAPSGQLIAMHPVGARGMSIKPIEGARGKSEWYDRLQGLFVDLRRGSGSTILSSSAGAEYALESSEQQNGLFTYAVLEALDGTKDADANKDGSVQMSELGEYVKKRVAGLTNNKQTPNTRRVNLEGDFVLSKSK